MSVQQIDLRNPEQILGLLGGQNQQVMRRMAEVDAEAVSYAQRNETIPGHIVALMDTLRTQHVTLIALMALVQASVRLVQPAGSIVQFGRPNG